MTTNVLHSSTDDKAQILNKNPDASTRGSPHRAVQTPAEYMHPANLMKWTGVSTGLPTPHELLQLQRAIGNQAVNQMLAGKTQRRPFIPSREPAELASSAKVSKSNAVAGKSLPVHVLQQGSQSLKVQRRILIDGDPWEPPDEFLSSLDSSMKEFVVNMDNDGSPPDFSFSSYNSTFAENFNDKTK